MINMQFAPCILICLTFVQSNGLHSSDLERGRYVLVEIDDVSKIATDQTESSSYLDSWSEVSSRRPPKSTEGDEF